MLSDYFSQIVENKVALLSTIILFGCYIIIVAFYSGSWWILNLRLNSNTKKAKKLLRIALYVAGIALFVLVFISPFFTERKNRELKNPYLGDWEIIESSLIELSEGQFLRIYISSSNTIIGDFTEFDGDKIAYLRSVEINHHNYNISSGKFSSERGARTNFKAVLMDDVIEVEFFDKESQSFIANIELKRK